MTNLRKINRVFIENALEAYNEIQSNGLKLAQRHEGYWIDGFWFSSAISEGDLTLTYQPGFQGGASIEFSGTAYTTQTMSHEYFEFVIPLTDLDL